MKMTLLFLITSASIAYANEMTEIIAVNGQSVSVKVNDLLEKAASLKASPKSVAGQIVMDQDGETATIIDPHFMIAGKKLGIFFTPITIMGDQWFNKKLGDIVCRRFGFKSSLNSIPFSTFGSSDEMANFSRSFNPASGYMYETVTDIEADGTPRSAGYQTVSERVLKSVRCRN